MGFADARAIGRDEASVHLRTCAGWGACRVVYLSCDRGQPPHDLTVRQPMPASQSVHISPFEAVAVQPGHRCCIAISENRKPPSQHLTYALGAATIEVSSVAVLVSSVSRHHSLIRWKATISVIMGSPHFLSAAHQSRQWRVESWQARRLREDADLVVRSQRLAPKRWVNRPTKSKASG
jgi:hypothetical protein